MRFWDLWHRLRFEVVLMRHLGMFLIGFGLGLMIAGIVILIFGHPHG